MFRTTLLRLSTHNPVLRVGARGFASTSVWRKPALTVGGDGAQVKKGSEGLHRRSSFRRSRHPILR